MNGVNICASAQMILPALKYEPVNKISVLSYLDSLGVGICFETHLSACIRSHYIQV